jgi:hypothetical protein
MAFEKRARGLRIYPSANCVSPGVRAAAYRATHGSQRASSMASVTGRGTPRTSHHAVTRQIANNRNANGRGMATTLSPSPRRSNRHILPL